MKDKLFKFLFPARWDQLKRIDKLEAQYISMYTKAKDLELQVKVTPKKPTYSDLMKSLGLDIPDLGEIANLQDVPHFYEGLSKGDRDAFIQELEGVTHNESLKKILKYWLTVYARFIACQATIQPQIYGGWMNTNVIGLILKDLNDAHTEYITSNKPEPEFDPFEVRPDYQDNE